MKRIAWTLVIASLVVACKQPEKQQPKQTVRVKHVVVHKKPDIKRIVVDIYSSSYKKPKGTRACFGCGPWPKFCTRVTRHTYDGYVGVIHYNKSTTDIYQNGYMTILASTKKGKSKLATLVKAYNKSIDSEYSNDIETRVFLDGIAGFRHGKTADYTLSHTGNKMGTLMTYSLNLPKIHRVGRDKYASLKFRLVVKDGILVGTSIKTKSLIKLKKMNFSRNMEIRYA